MSDRQRKIIRWIVIAIVAGILIWQLPNLLSFLLNLALFAVIVVPLFWLAALIWRSAPKNTDVKRGSELSSNLQELQAHLNRKQAAYLKERKQPDRQPHLTIAGVSLPNYLEDLGIFCLGSPGSGKTQAIAQLLETMQSREDFRCVVFDRNGEFTERFYREGHDRLFNPLDARSVAWSHRHEGARPEMIAGGLIPDASGDDRFFADAAKALMSDIFERCNTNAEVWQVLSALPLSDLPDFLQGGLSHRYFISEKTGGSVLSTAINYTRFYRSLPPDGEPFSFSQWARSSDSRSLFLPLFEEDSELLKPLYSMAFELVLKGLLAEEGRRMKTAIIVDELGALNQLRSLSRLVSESRKFGGCPVLGTQAIAQIEQIYGDKAAEILLQGTATKLLLNARDPRSAEVSANLIGKQEKWESSFTRSGLLRQSHTRQIREVHAVMPSEIQALPPMHGYLLVADGTPTTRVQLRHVDRPAIAARLEPRSNVAEFRRRA